MRFLRYISFQVLPPHGVPVPVQLRVRLGGLLGPCPLQQQLLSPHLRGPSLPRPHVLHHVLHHGLQHGLQHPRSPNLGQQRPPQLGQWPRPHPAQWATSVRASWSTSPCPASPWSSRSSQHIRAGHPGLPADCQDLLRGVSDILVFSL